MLSLREVKLDHQLATLTTQTFPTSPIASVISRPELGEPYLILTSEYYHGCYTRPNKDLREHLR